MYILFFSWVNNPWFHDEKINRDTTTCTNNCPEWIRICRHGNNLMTEVCRIRDLHTYIQTYIRTCTHVYIHTCIQCTYTTYIGGHNYKALHKLYLYMNLEESFINNVL